MTRGLEIAHDRVDGRRVLRLRGELDMGSAPTLVRLLDDVEVDGGGDLVLDVAELTFIDSTGVTVLLEANRRAHDRGGSFVVARPQPQARRLFELSGLDGVLVVEPA